MTIELKLTEETAEAFEAALIILAQRASAVTPPATDTTPPVVVAPPVADANTYPLAMPDGVIDGAPVTLGEGPDRIDINVANNPASGPPPNIFVVLVNGVAVAGPLTVTSNGGMSSIKGQVFSILGVFGPTPKITLAGAQTGWNSPWVNSLTYNYVPYAYTGKGTTGRGADKTIVYNQFSVWNNAGFNLDFTTPRPAAELPPPPPPLPPAPPLTEINGSTLAQLLTSTATGATLTLPTGIIVGTSDVPNACTITGAGIGKTVIDATNLPPFHKKGILEPLVAGVVVTDLTFKGAAIAPPDGNAAAMRDAGPGVGFTLDSVEITGCQNGLLTFPSNVTIKNSYIHDNGNGNPGGGYTHELYLGGAPDTVVNLENDIVTCGPLACHALHCRAGTTNITGGVYTGCSDATGNLGGAVIDIPDCGDVNFTSGRSVVAVGAANTVQLAYGMESAKNPGRTVTCTDWVFEDANGKGTQIQASGKAAGAKLVLVNCTYKGTAAPEIAGFVTVTGKLSAA